MEMVSTMKNYIRFGLIYGLTLIPSIAWVRAPGLSEARLQSVVSTDLRTCAEKIPVVPESDARVFPQARIEKTLNGVWRGKVSGEYDKKFVAKDGNLDVDYYMIVDTKRHEALVFEQLSSKRATGEKTASGPSWNYQMCGRERYLPAHPAQVHSFEKVSDNVEDARALLSASTGLKFDDKSELVLSAAWKKLVDSKYFDTSKSAAYAGGLFKPFDIGHVAAEENNGVAASNDTKSLFSMRYDAEYRGGGMTAAKFTPGVPMHGVEEAKFIGVSTPKGDYLVASLGNGVEMSKDVVSGGAINMFFDKVVIGPLAPQ